MDEDKFMTWFQNNYDDNAVMFAEKNEDDFEEYCLEKYTEQPDEDMIYEMMRDR